MEPVPECQSPLFLLHVDADDPERVRLYFSALAEAPTTRGFASILAAGLDYQPPLPPFWRYPTISMPSSGWPL